jgi:hypothetical protein
MNTIEVLQKARAAILLLCRHCDEIGSYGPPRHYRVENALTELDRKIDELNKAVDDALRKAEVVGCIHTDTLAMHLEKTDYIDPTAMWPARKLQWSTEHVPLYVIKEK